eukprot:PhM_4_TR17805/c0_g1_i1/m.60506
MGREEEDFAEEIYRRSSVERQARAAPKTLSLASVFLRHQDDVKDATPSEFLRNLVDVLTHAECQTTHLDLSFMGLTGSDRRSIDTLLTKAKSIGFFDFRKGNALLHTKEDIKMMEEVAVANDAVRLVLVKEGACQKVFGDGNVSPSKKIVSESLMLPFDELCQKFATIAHDYDWAVKLLERHRIPAVDILSCPADIKDYFRKLREDNRIKDAEELEKAFQKITDGAEKDLEVCDWAHDVLKKHQLKDSVYDEVRINQYLAMLRRDLRNDEIDTVNRALDVARRRIRLVLHRHDLTERDCAVDMMGVRKRIDALRDKNRHQDANELEDTMELAATAVGDVSAGFDKRQRSPSPNRTSRGGVQIIRRKR